MAKIKTEDLRRMNKEERTKKLSELKFELIKSKVSTSKTGSSKPREIRRVIARILTFNNKK